MRPVLTPCIIAAVMALTFNAVAADEKPSSNTYGQIVEERIAEGLKSLQRASSRAKNVDCAHKLALLLFLKGGDVEEANRLVLAFCRRDPLTKYVGKLVPKNRCEELFRIYLTDDIRARLSAEAKEAIEDYAWDLLTKYSRGITSADAEESFFPSFDSSENHYLNDRRRYHLALQILRKAGRYGPDAELEGKTIEAHCRAWDAFWIRYFRDRAGEGTDIEVAHPSSYGLCTVGVYYDLADLADSAEVRDLASKFLTLYWAEVATEFEPRTGQRAGWASTRNPHYDGRRVYWAQSVLYCYRWHDRGFLSDPLGLATFLASAYRPPEILSAIARNPNRGSYLATSHRAGMLAPDSEQGFPVIFDENGHSHLRRDVYYTPDYALSTITYDPKRHYRTSIVLAQAMGATFASDQHQRIVVLGTGYYARRAINGITGPAVSIIARDPNAEPGRGRFKSDGTRVFVSDGKLWKNRVEDESGWFFSRSGDAFAAIRAAGPGYRITNRTFIWPNRSLREVERTDRHYLELEDVWAPVVIQMGRARDYDDFHAFQESVKGNRFDYADGKLTYVSEANNTYEYWAKGARLPHINGTAVNLNPPKVFDSPFLSMEDGDSKAVISSPGHPNLTIDFQ